MVAGKLFVRRKAMASFMAIMFSLIFPGRNSMRSNEIAPHERDEIRQQAANGYLEKIRRDCQNR
jgi:hypothetical protein